MENLGPRGLGLEAIFTRLRSNVNLAPGVAVQPAERFDLLFGFGQRIELFIAQRQRGALDRFFADVGISERQQGVGGRMNLATVALRTPFPATPSATAHKRRRSFDQVAVVLGEQRLEGQFPELVVGRDDETRFAAQYPLSGLER